MEKMWGNLGKPTSIQLFGGTEEVALTKSHVRKKVWDFLEKHDLVNFPRPVHNRIPNFKGASTAGQLLASLPEFKKAHVVKVNPDKPQEEVRYQVLEQRKTLLVPTPRLRSGLFNLIENIGCCNKQQLKMLASRQGIDKESRPLPLTQKTNIDLVVIGCVAVDRLGHRIGKGEGYADLEFAMASTTGSITGNTIVMATVHDCQLFDSLPEEIFGDHDVPIDIIVTPTMIHRVTEKLPKPNRIIWEILSNEKFKRIPILKQMLEEERLHDRQSKHTTDGEEKIRKEVFNKCKDIQTNREVRKNRNNYIGYDRDSNENKRDGQKTSRSIGNHNEAELNRGIAESTKKDECIKSSSNVKNHNDDSDLHFLYVGKIPKSARVRDLKDVIFERDIRPKELVWKGFKGYAFLYFEKSVDIEETCESLQGLQLCGNILEIQKQKN